MDLLERALEALFVVKGAAQGSSREACVTLEGVVLGEEPPSIDGTSIGAPIVEATGVPPSQARRISPALPGAWRPLVRLMLGSYVKPLEVVLPKKDALAPDQEVARVLINYWRPFNQRDSPIVHMYYLCPHSYRLPTVARGEEYSIPIPANLYKGSYQRVAKDEMYICNHDFDETAELV